MKAFIESTCTADEKLVIDPFENHPRLLLEAMDIFKINRINPVIVNNQIFVYQLPKRKIQKVCNYININTDES